MNYIRAYIWAILWAAVMLFLMLRPSQQLGISTFFEGFDKMAHLGTFFVLTTILYWESILKHRNKSRKGITIVKVVSSTILFAFATEAAQYYLTSSRAAEWWDIFADVAGIGMATLSYLLYFKPKSR